MDIKNKFYIIIFFIIIEVFSILLLVYNTQSRKEQIINSANNLVETNYYNTYNSFSTLADAVYEGYINNSTVKDFFEHKDRDGLYKHLESDYQYLKNIDFEQIHFHLPTNHSFLRMHKPNRFGDDLTDIRYSVDFVNKNLAFTSGLEMGRVVPGFRYVYPVINNNKHIGSVETSFSVKSFIHKLEEVYNVHIHFLLKDEVFNKKIFDTYRKYYETSVESDNYITLSRGDKKKKKAIEELIKNEFRTNFMSELNNGLDSKDTFGLDLELKSKDIKHSHQVVTFLLLKNIQQEHIGYFVVYQNSKELLQLESDFIQLVIIVTFINILLSFIFYREITKKYRLEIEVEKKTKELTEFNNSLTHRIKEEVEKSKKQEQHLYEIEKMAQMGDMIGNIAHQWRQPLSIISTAASGLQVKQKFDLLSKKDLDKFKNIILLNTKYLSEIIDTFRNFIKEKKKYEEVELQDSLKTILEIIHASLQNNHIKLINQIDYNHSIKVKIISQELSQVLINILNNAKDIIKEKELIEPWIKINLEEKERYALITIEDNAGGIPSAILPKIFDPYFTTKHQSIGTGLGLHMSRNIIHNSLKGKLYAQNTLDGAKFFIEIPLV